MTVIAAAMQRMSGWRDLVPMRRDVGPLPIIRMGLMALVTAEILWFIGEALQPVRLPPILPSAAPHGSAAAASSAPAPSLVQSAPEALFARTLSRTGASGSGPGAMETLRARLKLQGVAFGHPGQAILEDAQAHATYVVTEGQPIVDGIRLETVARDHVVLRLGRETVELRR